MFNRALDDITERDFSSLVTSKVSEGRDLEFKRDLPGNSDNDVHEFLADVSSLANAQGGDLIFGVEDDGGVATGAPGIAETDADGTLLRLENMVRDGIEPRIRVKMRWIPLVSGRAMIVLRLPASLVAPHRVKRTRRFLGRNSRGKYDMDVQELRHAFTESEAMPQRLRQFHDAAVIAAQGIDMPIKVDPAPTAVLSLMPLGVLREARDLPLTHENTILPVKTQQARWLPTLEGTLWHSPLNDNQVRAYALTHRTGRIDSVWTIGADRDLGNGEMAKLVFPNSFEAGVVEMAQHGVGRLRSYGLEGPWVIMVTVLRIENARIPYDDRQLSRPAWRKQARFPELIFEHPNEAALLPLLQDFHLLFGETRPG